MPYKTNPKQLSLFLTTILLIFSTVIYYVLQILFFNTFYILPTLIFLLVCSPTFYILFRSTIEKFIYEKIRIIYKTIRSAKLGQNKLKHPFRKDMLEEVNQEVQDWVQVQEEKITELKRLEAYRREFLGNVSHELKTPITTIQGYVLTLLDGGLNDPKVNKKYLMRTAKSINRLTAIVNDLETISKFEAGVIHIDEMKFNIVILIRDVFEFMEMKAQKRNIKCIFDGNLEQAIYVIGDKNKIRQVLINLIDNSLKYGVDNGHTKISIFDMDDHVLIEITDNGIGMEEDEIPRVFERFYRTDKSRSRSQGGTGLGLAIVKHIIEAHNQTIYVRSKPSVGSTFAFTLQKPVKNGNKT